MLSDTGYAVYNCVGLKSGTSGTSGTTLFPCCLTTVVYCRSVIAPKCVTKNNRPYWMVRCPQNMGGARRFFRSQAEAERYARRINKIPKHDTLSHWLLSLDPNMKKDIYMAVTKAEGRTSLTEAVGFTLAQRPSNEIRLQESIVRCMEARKLQGNRLKTEHGFVSVARLFAKTLDNPQVSEITVDHIRHWLAGYENPNTRSSYLRSLKAFFNWLVANGYLVSSPAAAMERVRSDSNEIVPLTVDQTRELLLTAYRMYPEQVGFCAPILFGGLRTAESKHLEHPQQNYLVVRGKHAKHRHRRLIEINDTLRAWLGLPGVEVGRYSRDRMLKIKAELSYPWPSNAMRKSFSSYGVPIFGIAKTALMSAHSEAVLFKHYRAVVTEEAAREYWALRP